jgi:hypothetical protein
MLAAELNATVTATVRTCHRQVWFRHRDRRSIAPVNEREVHMHRAAAFVHVNVLELGRSLRREGGQGTVEYVALLLLVALVMAGLIAAMRNFKTDQGKELGDTLLGKIKEAVRKVQF